MEKKKPAARLIRTTVRWSEKEYNRLALLAKIYAGGDIAKWLRHAGLEAERKFLK